ncbi:MAG TPA: SsrA-binding protein SmpB [Brumimicrobium sp.]|nr:SsrA-binding protein SmpB [Brumimicrobium sp.]
MSQKNKINILNKRARFEYHLLDKYIAGIQLKGTEIKSIRRGKANIGDAFCVIENGQIFVRNMHIAEYENASFYQHNPKSDRKLLLNRKEIDRLDKKMQNKGLTIVPLRLFINEKGYAKLEISLAKGKKLYDKRQDLKEKDDKRAMDRIQKTF